MNSDFPVENFFNPTIDKSKNNEINKLPTREEGVVKKPLSDAVVKEAGSAILSDLRENLAPDTYAAFFETTFFLKAIHSDELVFNVSSDFVKRMVNQFYKSDLEAAVERVLGKQFRVVLNSYDESIETKIPEIPSSEAIQENKEYQVKKAQSVKNTSFMISDLKPTYDDMLTKVDSQVIDKTVTGSNFGKSIDTKKTFDNFVVGPSNNLAHASSIAVAKNPGNVYSSLYVHGNSGLGKTHLLHAVANYITDNFPSQRIYITTANEFMTEMISAIQAQDIQSFRNKYSEQIDVLMIDDIHELKNRQGTQNEFFHVFNELQRKKKQLIFTSDKDPKEITGIEDRIKTRLSSALVVEIQQPDLETRIAILKKKAIEENIYLPDDVVNLIASCIKNNIRELEGSLIKLGAYSSVFNVDIDLETAKEQLKLNVDDHKKTVNMETITKTVSTYFKVPVPDLRSKARNKHIALARHVAMYFSYYIAKSTLMEIGEYFGKRDHTSVMHGVNKIKKMAKDDQDFSHKVYEIESLL